MRHVETTGAGSAVLAMEIGELVAVMNAMNEAMELVPDAEFPSRLGVHRAEMLALWENFDEVRALLAD